MGSHSVFLCHCNIAMAEDGGVASSNVVRVTEWKALLLGVECIIK